MTISHKDLAYKFAHGATKGNGSNMFIDGDTIYSYGHHFPIAKRFRDGYLFNPGTYSVSTSAHQGCVFRAICHSPVWYATNCNPETLIQTQADKAEAAFLRIPKSRGLFSEYLNQLVKSIEKAIQIHDEFPEYSLQPMYDTFVSDIANLSMTKIKKRLVPEITSSFLMCSSFYMKSQFLATKKKHVY